MRLPVRRTALIAGATIALLTACGDAPEQRLERAGRQLDTARGEVEEAIRQAESARARVAEAELEHQEALHELRDARAQETRAEARLDTRASDVAVFRALQAQLLEADALRQAAVSVEVSDGLATLRGVVPDDAGRQRALEIARTTPGVERIRDELRVD